VKLGHAVLRYASRQTHKPTDRHTDTLITILYTPAGGEAHISIRLIMIMAYYIIGLYCNETASRTKTCKIYYKSEFNLPYNRRPWTTSDMPYDTDDFI